MEEQIVFRADRNFYFPSVERLRQAMNKVVSDGNRDSTYSRAIVIDLSRVSEIDHTSLKVN